MKNHRWKWVILLLFAVIAVVVGLLFFLKTDKPVISATFKYGYRNASPNETSSLADVYIKNPNHLPVTMDSAQYALFVDGIQVFTGHTIGNEQVKASEKMTFPIPFLFQTEDLQKQSLITDSGSMRLKSVFYFHYWNGETVIIPASWQVHIPRLPDFKLEIQNIIPQKATLKDAKALVSVTLKNTGVDAFTARNAYYSLTIDSVEIAGGFIPFPLNIEPRSEKGFTLPMKIDAGLALKQMAQNKNRYLLKVTFEPVSDKLPAYTGKVSCEASGTVTSLLQMASQ